VTATIRTRRGKKGPSYEVRYRRGGRAFKVESAGTFKTLREARTRRDLVGGWLAAGLDPREELARIKHKPAPRTFAQLAEAYRLTRVDLAQGTRDNMAVRIKTLTPLMEGREPERLTPADVQEIVGALASELAPGSVRNCLQTLRQVLDFAEIEPNPARHRSVKAPRETREEVAPPSASEVLAIIARVPRRFRLPLVVLEQTAMRIGELEALAWGDVDVTGLRFRLRSSTTKTAKPRWVQLPEWLMVAVGETCPQEDRTPERLVFPGFAPMAVRAAMRRACIAAGIPHYHPHDLRHRRASLWHGQGVVGAEVAKRGGWSKPTVPLNVYSHVMPLDEVAADAFAGVLR
jgi:integrase